jgi:DNA-directed RNA polymerase specialized sigma subunit
MLNHRVLSREEELELGRRIAVATALRDKLTDLADSRRMEREVYGDRRRRDADITSLEAYEERDSDIRNLPSDEELFQLGMGSSFSLIQGDDDNSLLLSEEGGFTIMDQSSNELAEDFSGFDNSDGDIPISLQEGSKFSARRLERDLAELSNEDVGESLGVAGGKDEVRTIIREGAEARREMMQCNIKLVVSIAKKWMKNNPDARVANGSLRELYEGGWDRPSLDEAIQEGVLGLSRAIDKYDYEKGLKFSTYSTWWITNYVRIAFQTAKTGPLKLPAQFYTLKNQYLKAIARLTREGRPIPPIEDFAEEFGTSVRRLRYALTATEALFSIDQPVNGQSTKLRGSSAGEIGVGNGDIYLGDALVW